MEIGVRIIATDALYPNIHAGDADECVWLKTQVPVLVALANRMPIGTCEAAGQLPIILWEIIEYTPI